MSTQVSWQKKYSPNENVHTISVAPDNTVYAATTSYGIFKSSDEGNNWLNISAGLPDSMVRVIQVSTDNKVFVGTGSNGIYQNAGGSWSAINNGLPSGNVLVTGFAKASNGTMYMIATTGLIYKWNGTIWTNITFNFPAIGRMIAVGPTGTLFGGSFTNGVYQFDGVNNWTIVGSAMPNNFVFNITVGQNDTIYALCNSNNIYRCHTSGGTWTLINTGLPSTNMNFIASDAQNRIFVGSSSTYGVIYRSLNNGNSWSSATPGLFTTSFGCIAFSSSGKTYTGTSGIFRSQDGGDNWQDINSGLDAARSVFCFKCTRNGTYFVANRLGVWRSSDSGNTWQYRITGISHFNVLQITENAVGDILFHAFNNTPKGAIYRSTNNGDNWTLVAANGCDLYTKIKQHKTDTIWASSRFSGATTLSYSVNNGATWNNNPLDISAIWDIDVTADHTIFVGSESEGISRSDNGGQSFTLGVGNTIPWYGNLLEVERDENGVIFAGTDWWTNVLWYSLPEENGNSWTKFTDPDLVIHGIQDLIFDHFNNAWLACNDGGVRMAYNDNWNESTDWISSSSGLPSSNTNILELSFDTSGYMYAIAYTNNGHNGGLYKSTVPVNLPQSSVYRFIGNGSWESTTNWENNHKPSTELSGNKMIIIDPVTNGECVLQTPLQLTNGAVLKIRPNKLLKLTD
ncbi:MAG: hypothetical protein H7X99_11135 [Saprospiraceae bacterium]|nr:hypothetical protein [Saprospiraceae bacterium]